jgi:hypothetical protein
VGQDIGSHLFRQLREFTTLHAPDVYVPFFFSRITFCRDRDSVTDETLLPIGYSVERGEVRKNRGEVGGNYEIFSPQTALSSSTLAVIVIIRPYSTPYQRFPCGKKSSSSLSVSPEEKNMDSRLVLLRSCFSALSLLCYDNFRLPLSK